MPPPRKPQIPLTDAHKRLGEALRRTRLASGVSTRSVPSAQPSRHYFSSGHISLVESGRTAPSPELLDAYVALGGDRAELSALYQQMLAATRAAGRARRLGAPVRPQMDPPQSMADISDRRDVQRHYVVESEDVHYTFASTGAVRDAACVVQLRALAEGVQIYYIGFNYPAESRPGVLEVQPVSGARILKVKESESGSVGAYLALDRVLMPGDPDPCLVALRVVVRSDARSAPRLRYFAAQGNERLVLTASFHQEALPQSAWWFTASDVVDAEHAQLGRDTAVGDGGTFSRSFEGLIPGWCYGLGWAW